MGRSSAGTEGPPIFRRGVANVSPVEGSEKQSAVLSKNREDGQDVVDAHISVGIHVCGAIPGVIPNETAELGQGLQDVCRTHHAVLIQVLFAWRRTQRDRKEVVAYNGCGVGGEGEVGGAFEEGVSAG